MRVGILTAGGDCPGLNAVIRGAVRNAEVRYGDEVVGFSDGWLGVMEGRSRPLDIRACRGILPLGGTLLGTSRVSPYHSGDGVDRVMETIEAQAVDAVIAVGGEGSLSIAMRIYEDRGLAVVGVPKTIDNDLRGTEVTFGFDTAVAIACEAIDRLHTTAESHHRDMVVEVMGRHVGWIATYAGIAGGAAEILVPEEPFDMDAVAAQVRRRHARGVYSAIVVVAEGALPKEGTMTMPPKEYDQYGHVRLGGIGNLVAAELEKRTGYETRVTILGHVQRGGSPTAFDRILATRFGVAALDAVHDRAFGQMVALQSGHVVRVPLSEAVAGLKTVDPAVYHGVAKLFSG